MLDKTEYYHGAAIIRLLEDSRCEAVRKRAHLGYVVNGRYFVLLKYTAKARSPWGFSFDQEDIDRCAKMATEHDALFIGLICGGDGVCVLSWREANELLAGKPGRIAAGRKHNERYAVWGTAGEMKRKVPVGRWPLILFESATTAATSTNTP